MAAPAVVGSNCRVRVAVCPGFSVTGKVNPVMVKPVPVIVAALMVTADVPEEVSVTVCVEVVLRVTLPKATVDEPSVRVPAPPPAACPVPLRLMVTFPLLVALLEIAIDPVTAPAAVGSNVTWRVTL